MGEKFPGADSPFSVLERTLSSSGPPLPNAPSLTVGDLFEIRSGNGFALGRLEQAEVGGVAFVSRTSRNNGVSGRVAVVDGVAPFPAGALTVALGGTVLEAFVQDEPFYSGHDIGVLCPKYAMSLEEKLFFAEAIRLHKFRYSYGRQANRTLAGLRLRIPSADELTVSIADIGGRWATGERPRNERAA